MSESEKQYCSEQKNVQISSRLSNGPLTAPSYFHSVKIRKFTLIRNTFWGKQLTVPFRAKGVDFTEFLLKNGESKFA